jgi:hypothetical protein
MAKLRLQVQRGTLAAAASAAAAAGGGSDGAAVAAQPQVQQQLPAFRYRNLVHGLRSIVAAEGWPALFRGAGARMAFHAPSTAISMLLFERCRDAFAQLLGDSKRSGTT